MIKKIWCSVGNSIACFLPSVTLAFLLAISLQCLGLVWCLITMVRLPRELLIHGSEEQLWAYSSYFTLCQCGIRSFRGTSKRWGSSEVIAGLSQPSSLTARFSGVDQDEHEWVWLRLSESGPNKESVPMCFLLFCFAMNAFGGAVSNFGMLKRNKIAITFVYFNSVNAKFKVWLNITLANMSFVFKYVISHAVRVIGLWVFKK